MTSQIKGIRGGGLQYVSDTMLTENRIFIAGMRHHRLKQGYNMPGFNPLSTDDHDNVNYERGGVYHARSLSTQIYSFHYFYGGLKKYMVDRWWIGKVATSGCKVMVPMSFFCFLFGCYTTRRYDNSAYNHFYFSE